MDISSIRSDYAKLELTENNVLQNPFSQFDRWFTETLKSEALEPNAMHLSTIGAQNRPTGRIVLLKAIDSEGFSFFTNYESKKANEIRNNNNGSLTFFWPELERQIRIEGLIVKISETESIKYFSERPWKSQLGAWASPQSKTVDSRSILEENYFKLEQQYEGKKIPKPNFWGGYKLLPDYFEFWQGRRSRLHDRIIYKLCKENKWEISRIAP